MELKAADTPAAADPREAAESAGLVYVTDEMAGIRREAGRASFTYLKPKGDPVSDEAVLDRIRRLAIPPAWTDVWICTKASGHLQATGRDARGRKQYKYHPQFREARESTKYEHMVAFAKALPALRARVAEHMGLRGLPREKVLATVVQLLDTTLIRVGNDDYAKANGSYGLTTLRNRHVKVEGTQLRFQFKGKSGKHWKLQVKNPRVARIIRACQDLPGQELFQYLDEGGEVRRISSSDVNAYLKEATGGDITAKDFRTWAGTVMAALALHGSEIAQTQAAAKRTLRTAIEQVASRLGNTPTICRKCYVHPEVFSAYAQGALQLELPDQATRDAEAQADIAALKAEEKAVLAFLETRLGRTLADELEQSVKEARRTGRAPASKTAKAPRSRSPQDANARRAPA
ncbi:DNA topoisomerase IB [Ramlibacter sp.]|uniref:DNA topoisomerase IB n=1 Tax=Ramlibacter sp. TaxID=1917967 RepID=UPI001853E8AD|nr:DNA topoisomerase IB [Ramlibacter sp.]MBA2672131.1 DNA topoisomerase IB [Ramlibacter sp.]